jgi:hypothetical protein
VGNLKNTKKKGGGKEKMKFMAVFEWDLTQQVRENFEKKRQQIAAEREKFPDKFPKPLEILGFLGGNTKGFALYETDDDQQLLNFQEYYSPELKIKWIPILGP